MPRQARPPAARPGRPDVTPGRRSATRSSDRGRRRLTHGVLGHRGDAHRSIGGCRARDHTQRRPCRAGQRGPSGRQARGLRKASLGIDSRQDGALVRLAAETGLVMPGVSTSASRRMSRTLPEWFGTGPSGSHGLSPGRTCRTGCSWRPTGTGGSCPPGRAACGPWQTSGRTGWTSSAVVTDTRIESVLADLHTFVPERYPAARRAHVRRG